MDTSERTRTAPAGSSRGQSRQTSTRALRWLGGGTLGNEQLTVTAGVVLLVLLPVLGVTILRIGQLISVHLFVGFLLIGPLALKLASTGYRFFRYYAGNQVYRHKGPPGMLLRLLAPALVLSTVIVFVTGVLLMFAGPSHPGWLLLGHKASFIVWLAAAGVHVLGHLPRLGKSLRVARANRAQHYFSPGAAGRRLAIVGALAGGLVLAIVLIPDFAAWTAHGAFSHHHD